MASKHLYRSRDNRVIGGVAGGLGEYFDLDPIVIRLLFVLLAVGGGSGVLIYIIAWILMPEEPTVTKEKNSEKSFEETIESNVKDMADKVEKSAKKIHERSSVSGGLILLVIGVLFLLQNMTGFDVWGNFWPIILVVIGLGLIARSSKS
ncbi:MAG TPA: PspC domain-containing protein [Patescibacteria group bacterium]